MFCKVKEKRGGDWKLYALFYKCRWLTEVILTRKCILRLLLDVVTVSRAKVTGNSKFFPLIF